MGKLKILHDVENTFITQSNNNFPVVNNISIKHKYINIHIFSFTSYTQNKFSTVIFLSELLIMQAAEKRRLYKNILHFTCKISYVKKPIVEEKMFPLFRLLPCNMEKVSIFPWKYGNINRTQNFPPFYLVISLLEYTLNNDILYDSELYIYIYEVKKISFKLKLLKY